MPLIAALFDAFVDVYKEILVRHGAIPRALDDLAEMAERDPAWRGRARAGFARAYARHPGRFHDALVEAREIAATMLRRPLAPRRPDAPSASATSPPILEEVDFARSSAASLRPIVAGAFARRGIGIVPPGPRLRPPGSRQPPAFGADRSPE